MTEEERKQQEALDTLYGFVWLVMNIGLPLSAYYWKLAEWGGTGAGMLAVAVLSVVVFVFYMDN